MIRSTGAFKLQFGGNLRAHARWFEYLASKELDAEIHRRFESSTTLKALRKVVQEVVESEIYSIGRETGNIKASVTAVAGEDEKENGVAVFFDPRISGSKGPFDQGDPSMASYAAFFEKPEFNSFILGKGLDVTNPLKHRPFHAPMTQAYSEESARQSVRSILSAMRLNRPKQS